SKTERSLYDDRQAILEKHKKALIQLQASEIMGVNIAAPMQVTKNAHVEELKQFDKHVIRRMDKEIAVVQDSLSKAAHFIRDIPSSEVSKTLDAPDSYRLLYFPIEGNGQTSRDVLAYGEAKWEDLYPEDWGRQKNEMPFNCLPVLYVIKDGKEVTISETSVIESYLAKQFGLLGENPYEESLILALTSSSTSLLVSLGSSVTWHVTRNQAMEQCLEAFKNNVLATWIATHERHLVDNGSNGYYFGNKLTLADIKTANIIAHIEHQPLGAGGEMIESIKASPALWKLKETVHNHPKLIQWRKGEVHQKLAATTKHFYSDPLANATSL
ncbi:hypothetical protein BGX28_008626, partial [Mortierella sp. GBA30]